MEKRNYNTEGLELVTPETSSLEQVDAQIKSKETEVATLKELNAVENNFQKEAERQFKIDRIQKDIANLIANRNDIIRAESKPNTDGAFNWEDPTYHNGRSIK